MSELVPDGLPWAHLDVAGPAFNAGGAYGYTSPGGTGVPVRTLLATLGGHRGSGGLTSVTPHVAARHGCECGAPVPGATPDQMSPSASRSARCCRIVCRRE